MGSFGLRARKMVLRIPGVYRLANKLRWRAFMKPGDTVVQAGVDMGAKMDKGLIPNAIAMSQIVGPAGKVIAIEPSNESVKRLQAYILSYGIENILPIEKALWHKKELMPLRLGNESWHNRLDAIQSKSDQVDVFFGDALVEADTLDNILDELHVDNVSHVCLTINGAEYNALIGMTKILQQKKISLLIAGGATQCFLQNPDEIPVTEKIANLLVENGFEISVDKIGWLIAKKDEY